MKSFVTLIIALIITTVSLHATVHTVSNNTFSPGQSTSLQNAIDSANAGDTIYVEPSPYDYGAITMEKQVYLFGGGGVPYTYQFNYVTEVDQVNFSVNSNYPYNNASGTSMQGFYMNGTVYVNNGLKNITIARNFFTSELALDGPDTGAVVINNIFAYNNVVRLNGSNPNDITATIANNFFAGANNGNPVGIQGNFVSEVGVYLENNIFYGNYTGATNQNNFFSGVDYVSVWNNIFFCDGAQAQTFISGCSNCNFQNNITYSPNTNQPNGNQTLPDAGNTGSGNYSNQNPDFVNPPANYTYIAASDLYIYNWSLTSASPGHLGGVDGTDVGIYGGQFPMPNLENVTRLPQVRQLNITNSSVAPNGTLNVKVIGTTRN